MDFGIWLVHLSIPHLLSLWETSKILFDASVSVAVSPNCDHVYSPGALAFIAILWTLSSEHMPRRNNCTIPSFSHSNPLFSCPTPPSLHVQRDLSFPSVSQQYTCFTLICIWQSTNSKIDPIVILCTFIAENWVEWWIYQFMVSSLHLTLTSIQLPHPSTQWLSTLIA